MSEKKKLKSARELVLSLDPALAEQVLNEAARYEGTDFPVYEDLADLIVSGFSWNETPQGVDYWDKVYKGALVNRNAQS